MKKIKFLLPFLVLLLVLTSCSGAYIECEFLNVESLGNTFTYKHTKTTLEVHLYTDKDDNKYYFLEDYKKKNIDFVSEDDKKLYYDRFIGYIDYEVIPKLYINSHKVILDGNFIESDKEGTDYVGFDNKTTYKELKNNKILSLRTTPNQNEVKLDSDYIVEIKKAESYVLFNELATIQYTKLEEE